VISRFVTLLILLTASTVFAQTNNANQTQGNVATEAEVAQYFSKYVYELKKSYKVFHWFNGAGRNAVWSSRLSASNPSGYDHLVNLSRRYYNAFCSQKNPSANPSDCDLSDLQYGRDGYYGPGLYASLDPVATAAFGGGSGWVLMQIQLPKGYRVADLTKDQDVSIPPEVLNFFSQEGCKSTVKSWYRLFSAGMENVNGYNRVDEKCNLMIRRLLKDRLKVDGFFYRYGTSNFQGCNQSSTIIPQSAETAAIGGYQGPFGVRALIVANTDKITASDVRVFNSQTSDAKADRTFIMSAFENIRSGYGSFFNWKDIIPQDRDPQINKWLQENIIGCSNDVPYGPAGGAQ